MTTSNGDPPKRVLGTGYVTAPAECFSNEPTTGVYLDTPGSMSAYTVTKRGNKRLRISDSKTEVIGPFYADGYVPPSTPWLIPDGTEAAPGLAFVTPNSDTGLYLPRPGTLAITCGGSDSLECTNGDIDIKSGACLMTQMFLKSDGDLFNPQITFLNHPETGFYYDGAVPGIGIGLNSDLNIMFGNVIKPAKEIQSQAILGPSQCSYGFDGYPGVGLSISGSNGLALDHNGVEVVDVEQSGVTFNSPIVATTVDISADHLFQTQLYTRSVMTANQALVGGVTASASFGDYWADFGGHANWNTSFPASTFTLPGSPTRSGDLFTIMYTMHFTGNTGEKFCYIDVNGAGFILGGASSSGTTSSVVNVLSGSFEGYLTPGASIRIRVWSSAGCTLFGTAAGNGFYSYVTIIRKVG